MATTTNFGWETPDDTDLVKDGAAAIRTALGGVDTSFIDLKGGTTGQVLTKASNTDLDYSWTAIDPLVILDAKGDLISATAADTPARLAVGTNGQVLTADSTASTGLKWASPASGGMTLITEVALSAISSYSFSSIPGTYKHLLLVWDGLTQSATSSTFSLRINNDSSTAYKDQSIYFETGSGPSVTATANTSVGAETFGTHITGTQAIQKGNGSLMIYNYASATNFKQYTGYWSFYSNNNARVNFYQVSSFYESATAITSLDIVRLTGGATMSNLANTTVRLYGVS